MRPCPRIGTATLACLVALVSLVSCATPRRFPLEMVAEDSGAVLFRAEVTEGATFTVRFLHSYDRAFFAEHYAVDRTGQILFTHMTFKSNLNGGGFRYTDFHLRDDGVGEIRNIDEPVDSVRFMVGYRDLANHTLVIAGEEYPVVNYAEPGTIVSVRVRRSPTPEPAL